MSKVKDIVEVLGHEVGPEDLGHYRHIRASDARQQFSETVDSLRMSRERVVVCRHNQPVAAIVPIEDLQRLEALDRYRDTSAVAKGFDSEKALKNARYLEVSREPETDRQERGADAGAEIEPEVLEAAMRALTETRYGRRLKSYQPRNVRERLRRSLAKLEEIGDEGDPAEVERVFESIAASTEAGAMRLGLIELGAVLADAGLPHEVSERALTIVERMLGQKIEEATAHAGPAVRE